MKSIFVTLLKNEQQVLPNLVEVTVVGRFKVKEIPFPMSKGKFKDSMQ